MRAHENYSTAVRVSAAHQEGDSHMDERYRLPPESMIVRQHSGEAEARQRRIYEHQLRNLLAMMQEDPDYTLTEVLNGNLLVLAWFFEQVQAAYPPEDFQSIAEQCRLQFNRMMDMLSQPTA